tara:strand:+ start:461 stop:781 length:321 start_codon:yes stop_codon:yes gene_type:complete
MEKNLNIIEKFCGIKPDNQKLIEIGNDPNFIFENDPNFQTIKLFSPEGDIINVNSWIECAHYVNGGFTTTFNVYTGELTYLLITLAISFLYISIKFIKNRITSNEI